ncbi:MAG TPA: aminotransferase class V-fold PLP-dependent enzyme [Thermoanaerobaculia bacterium]|jgi:isopenicillin-N epimerase|nr:aminotransferase class V-fold PLP-dependent enzyme [Thermoanaerobaculia bacterium]
MSTSPFGRSFLSHWPLDPEITYLNHGTVGVTPRRVLDFQQKLRDEMERQPARFILRELSEESGRHDLPQTRLRAAAGKVAEFLGVSASDLVFVQNATTGVNAVLRSFDFRPGDEILIANLAYGAVARTAQFVARERGAEVLPVDLPFPPPDSAAVVNAYLRQVTPRTRLAVVDAITAETALVLPVREITAALHARGVAVLVDAAHAPGAIPVDVPSLGVDWYVANLHKWAFAPRGCAILWAAPERQEGLRPSITSWGFEQGFLKEFEWVPTYDPTPYLSAPEGIAFLRDLGVEAVQSYNHDLAWKGGHRLAERWGTEADLTTPEAMIGTMISVPLPAALGSTRADAGALKDALLYEDHIEVNPFALGGRLWIRIAAQVYNDLEDFDRLGAAIEARTLKPAAVG